MLGSVLGSVVWFPAARPAARKGFCGLWRKIKKTASACGIRVWGGGRARARTVDPLIKSQRRVCLHHILSWPIFPKNVDIIGFFRSLC